MLLEQKMEERGRYTTSKIQTMGNSWCGSALSLKVFRWMSTEAWAGPGLWNGMEWYGNMQKHPLSPFKELEKSEHFEPLKSLKEVKSLNKSLGL